MNYVILRDDDTNAFTPPEFLDRLYRPFLERGLPVNLAIIPDVSSNAKTADGQREGFLMRLDSRSHRASSYPIASNPRLVSYLLDNPEYSIVQHGCHHEHFEFDRPARAEVAARLDCGTQRLREAGFSRPQTFVAPHDKFSPAALAEAASRFQVLSSGWFESRRLPWTWWPRYAWKKLRQADHWRMGRTLLLSHPGCLLSFQRCYSSMLGPLVHRLNTQRLTVLVTHWWEYFREGQPDEPLIEFLHETAAYLARHPRLKVIRFSDLLEDGIEI